MSTGSEEKPKAGLKKELGLGEPKAKANGSTEQADKFKAAFQAEIKKVNEHLQYTGAHAEKAKHDPHAGKRDNTYSAFQMAMGKIDPTNPSAAQSVIDQVLSSVKGLGSTVDSVRKTVEKAFNEWKSREPDVDDVTDKVREMVEWGHEKAQALQQVVEAIVAKAAERKYEEAVSAVEQMKGKATEIYEDYLKQKSAEEEYQGGVGGLETQIAQMEEEEEALQDDLKAKKDEIKAAEEEMRQKAECKDYVSAVDMLKCLLEKVAAFLVELAEKMKLIAEYEAARKAALAKYEECHFLANSYEPLKGDQQKLKPKLDAVDAAAAAKNYEEAKKLADDLKAACEAYMEKAKKEQEKYDTKAAEITKELDGADDLKRQEVARKIAGELKPDVIKHMPIEVRNRLMQEMQKDGFSADDKKALDNLYKTRTLDPKFEEAERVKREELIEKLKSDPEFAKARENWKDMSKEDRLEIIKKAANIHADVYDTKDIEPKLTVKEKYKETKKDADGNVIGWNNGVYNHRTGEIGINTNPYGYVDEDGNYVGVKFNDFDKSIDLAVHESGHRYQSALIEKLKSGKLKKGDPEYNQAVSFAMNDPLAIAYKSEDDPHKHTYYAREGAQYYNQPMEAHSRESAGEVQASGVGTDHDHDHDHDDHDH